MSMSMSMYMGCKVTSGTWYEWYGYKRHMVRMAWIRRGVIDKTMLLVWALFLLCGPHVQPANEVNLVRLASSSR